MKTDYISYYERLNYLKELILKKRISGTKDICEKFDCCDKTARNMINKLRDNGNEIFYCRHSKKYLLKNTLR